ncbi:MAG: glycosyltransferase [Prolixibacteraceae bacterium]|jgi:glycosyltransferase involved in cell wall biosynthesis|nr:glycosyltransferase [Prolixibacteraceae bacterium]
MILDKITKEYVDKVFLDEEEYLGKNKKVNQTVPKVSVWVITYNQEKYISECLDSILMQEVDFDYEIVIGEDGSSDNTREICKKYADKYPEKIRLFLRDREKSAIYDRNGKFKRSINSFLTFKACRADYVALCEGDDYWTCKDKLKLQYNIVKDDSNVSMVYMDHTIRNRRTGKMKVSSTKQFKCFKNNISKIDKIHTSTLLVSRSCIYFNENWMYNLNITDLTIKIKAIILGDIRYVKKRVSVYNIFNEGSWSSTLVDKRILLKSYKSWLILLNYLKGRGYFSTVQYVKNRELRRYRSSIRIVLIEKKNIFLAVLCLLPVFLMRQYSIYTHKRYWKL